MDEFTHGTPCPMEKGFSSPSGSSECITLNSVWIATSLDEKDCFCYLSPSNSVESIAGWFFRID